MWTTVFKMQALTQGDYGLFQMLRAMLKWNFWQWEYCIANAEGVEWYAYPYWAFACLSALREKAFHESSFRWKICWRCMKCSVGCVHYYMYFLDRWKRDCSLLHAPFSQKTCFIFCYNWVNTRERLQAYFITRELRFKLLIVSGQWYGNDNEDVMLLEKCFSFALPTRTG